MTHHHNHTHAHSHSHGHSHAPLTEGAGAIGGQRMRRLATYFSVAVATTLIITKLMAWVMTDSVTMLSSLLDSTIDLIASCVTAYGVASALRPPDQDHRFGHGKAEPLAALAQAAFIVGSSVLLAYEALGRLYEPRVVQQENVAYAVMGLAMVLTFALVQFQRYVIRHTGSVAVHADHLHYVGDLASNFAVICAFLLTKATGLAWIDPACALLIAVYLVRSAWGIARQALNILMDQELPDDDRKKIMGIITAQPLVMGVHDVRTRFDSDRIFIEAHVEMDGELTLNTTHDVAEGIIAAIRTHYPNAEVLVHQDPKGHEEDRLDTRIEQGA